MRTATTGVMWTLSQRQPWARRMPQSTILNRRMGCHVTCVITHAAADKLIG